jgi:hypothetical protein
VEQEVGGSSPPNCTSANNHLVKVWFGAVWSGVNMLLEPQHACPRHAVRESMDAYEMEAVVFALAKRTDARAVPYT